MTTDNAGSSDSYEDENVKITYTQYTTNGTTIHVADVRLSSAEYLKTAFADDTYGKNVTEATSAIAEAHDAILAINGDYYGFRDSGYVVRSGYLYRSTPARDPDQEDLVLYEDGSAEILKEADTSAEVLWENGAREIFSFGPGLVIDGGLSSLCPVGAV